MRINSGAIARALITTALVGFAVDQAGAGNIFLTGHDSDFHDSAGSPFAGPALNSDIAFVRAGSTLPVLVLDDGSELSSSLTGLGVPIVSVLPTALTNAMLNPTLYSAIAVASEVSCGGCDNTPADNAAIATHLTAIAAFVTAGRGILGLAGAQDPLAYAYVPTAASNGGGNPPATGFVETAAGLAEGLVAENGDATHNFFSTPGTGGLSSLFQVAEVNGTTGLPEVSTWLMRILGFAGLGFLGCRKTGKSRGLRAVTTA
jgi:hypothetical protein